MEKACRLRYQVDSASKVCEINEYINWCVQNSPNKLTIQKMLQYYPNGDGRVVLNLQAKRNIRLHYLENFTGVANNRSDDFTTGST